MTSHTPNKNPAPSGYVPCACRDCMEIAIAKADEQHAYCVACKGAGCSDHQGVAGVSQECRAAGAYGGDDTA